MKKSGASATPSSAPASLPEQPRSLKNIAVSSGAKRQDGRRHARIARARAEIGLQIIDKVDERISDMGLVGHATALTVRHEEFLPSYHRLWDGIPEENGYKADLNLSLDNRGAARAHRFAPQSRRHPVERDL